MHIFPPQLDIGDEEGFDPKKDIFQLADFGQRLMNLNERVVDPMVIALDGPWGSGKTTFTKMWLGLLRKNGFPVIYFDAFANDHIDDAFTAIASEVIALADKKGVGGRGTFKQKTISVGKILLPSIAKIGAKALTLGALSPEDWDSLKSIPDSVANEVSGLTDKHLRAQLENHTQKRSAFKEFRNALEEMAKMLSVSSRINDQKEMSEDNKEQKHPNRPLIFVIDELDRCKPVFALALLEKIKHFFSVNGVNFVLVTNLKQLKNSVKFSYGNEDDDALVYLQKFYNLVVHLPEERRQRGEGNIEKFLLYIFDKFPDDTAEARYKRILIANLSQIAKIKGYSFRTIEKIATLTALVLATTNDKTLREPPLVAGLCVLKVDNPELYKRAQIGSLNLGGIEKFFEFDKWEDNTKTHSARSLWEYCIADKLDKEGPPWGDYSKEFARFDVDRKQAIPILCRDIIDGMYFPG